MPIYGKTPNQSKTLSGHSPLTFYSNGDNLTSYTISGNGKQDGTPSPDNIIMPEFCGVRTGQLIPYPYYQSDGTVNGVTWTTYSDGRVVGTGKTSGGTNFQMAMDLALPNGTYTITVYGAHSGMTLYLRDITASKFLVNIEPSSSDASQTFTVNQPGVHRLYFNTGYTGRDVDIDCYVMLNLGSTALPYEPHGYKIPITCAGQTQTVYLGQTQTVRRVRKLVLTGDETWGKSQSTNTFYIQNTPGTSLTNRNLTMCSHFEHTGQTKGAYGTYYTPPTSVHQFNFVWNESATVEEWKSYLAAQYAAGTPVTVWYVLAEPTTGIVNEPLMKIGDYFDTVSSSNTGAPQIPTVGGKNVLSVDTDIRPSLNTIQYTSGNEPIKKIYGNVSGQYKEVSKVLDASGNLVWETPIYSDWNTIREVVRAGKAAQYYPIGSILYDNFDETTGVAYQVVGYDKHFDSALTDAGYTHSMTLCELLLTDVITFDAIEAFLYVTTAIPAGTYKFTIPNYDASYGGNKTYYFTSTAELPVNSQIVMNWPYNQTPKTVTGYAPTASLTAMENTTAATGWNALTLTEWVEGTSPTATDLGTIAGPSTQAGTSNYGDMNHIQRARYGSNNYYESGVRQYINATGTANTWWKPSNKFDRPYGSRNIDGKLNKLNQNFVNVLAYPTIKSKANTYFETAAKDGTTFTLGQDYTITTDKMFLLSPVEIGFSTTDTSIGTLLDYYVGATNETRQKIRKSTGQPYYWWLRPPYPSNANSVRSVTSSGALSSDVASNSYGVAPACVIQ